ncbi:hypothetical protein RDV84_21970 [Lysobacter yananisis]|uniref:Uncharacterized protein n=1 Tax=Lysobacter yananisis TaxID=1003114 RepID=A0ABY9P6H0_9GAMM|nr:hypothetical protein [Lysobacter yananisis]WMT02599.1 hypothetical protein RDV84_21970 [Lysobacter yananisis]
MRTAEADPVKTGGRSRRAAHAAARPMQEIMGPAKRNRCDSRIGRAGGIQSCAARTVNDGRGLFSDDAAAESIAAASVTSGANADADAENPERVRSGIGARVRRCRVQRRTGVASASAPPSATSARFSSR